jgi:hypothetical protein
MVIVVSKKVKYFLAFYFKCLNFCLFVNCWASMLGETEKESSYIVAREVFKNC